MAHIARFAVGALLLMALSWTSPAAAQQTETRLALVVGNSGYQPGGPATAANDAGLIAQTLQAAGFDVVGARDLDLDSLRRAFRDFLDKATLSGPNTVAFVYFSGYGLQLEGENYLVPVDAKLARDTDVPVEALRVSDYTKALAALHLKALFVVLDAARAHPFVKDGKPLASGLALMEPDPGVLIAFNATPGTIAPDEQGPYGVYAQGLVEMLRAGGLAPGEVFDQARLRVNDLSQGADVPWDQSKIDAPFVFFERAADAPPPAAADQVSAIRSRPIRDLGAHEAYLMALDRDTIDAYEDFLAAYPRDPMAKRVHAILAARREAIVWRRTYVIGTPEAYWSYLRRYPDGPHAWDARRRLARLAAELDPPPSFAVVAYDVPPPPPEEVVYIDRPVLMFADPDFGFAPPPPPPVYLLPPRPPELIVLAAPPRPTAAFVLPAPAFVPVPLYVHAPRYVAPPPNNPIFLNIHAQGNAAGRPAGAAAPPSLPPSLGQRAGLPPTNAAPGAPGTPGSRAPIGNLPSPSRNIAPGMPPGAGASQGQPGRPPIPPVSGKPLPPNQGRANLPTPGGGAQNGPGARPMTSSGGPTPTPTLPGSRAPLPNNAAVMPSSPPNAHPSPSAPSNPSSSASRSATPPVIRPAVPPPPSVAKPVAPPPAVVHVPPPPAVHAPPPPAVHASPPPPAAHPPAPTAAARAAPPACPPGKSLQTVNGHQICK